MFKNIGKKIKGLAKIVFWVEFISTILAGFGFIISSFFWVDEPIAVVGVIIAAIVGVAILFLLEWMSVWMLYAFGELVDNSTIIAKEITEHKPPKHMPPPPHPIEEPVPADVQ